MEEVSDEDEAADIEEENMRSVSQHRRPRVRGRQTSAIHYDVFVIHLSELIYTVFYVLYQFPLGCIFHRNFH